MNKKSEQPPKSFGILYKGSLALGLAPLLYAIFIGLTVEGEGVFLLAIVLAVFFWVPAALSVFLFLNIWGLIKYKEERKDHLIVVIFLLLYIGTAILLFQNWTPL